ncbi:hypothetical protein LSM04_005974 [Trypanosoma melophagium]|uniref:uncharacterized protein n=1 Tax=Trypanosoma melophagium TaxID=715481 RepID=UPI00351A292A|nr:hypothetical protein LSM04_005974 [Trypanosoma melophagium]
MENRMASLERLSQPRPNSHTHFNTAPSPQQDSFTGKTESLSSPRSLPPNPFLRSAAPQTITSLRQKEITDMSTDMSAVNFERLVVKKSCEERLLLRDYEIERKLAHVSEYRKGNDTCKLLIVARLQEGLLVLLRAQEKDEQERQQAKGETKNKKKEKGGEINSPQASTRTGMKSSVPVVSEFIDSDMDEENDDENTLSATTKGKQWCEYHLGEHLSAFKEKMLQDIFYGQKPSF